MRKRGVSQLVATVLLIAFVVALIVLIILWGKHYIEERIEKEGGISQEKLSCATDVEIAVNDFNYVGNQMSVTVENLGEAVINSFIMQVHGSNGVDPVELYEPLGKLSVETFTFEFDVAVVGTPEKVDVIPQLEVADSVYVPCSDQHVARKV